MGSLVTDEGEGRRLEGAGIVEELAEETEGRRSVKLPRTALRTATLLSAAFLRVHERTVRTSLEV